MLRQTSSNFQLNSNQVQIKMSQSQFASIENQNSNLIGIIIIKCFFTNSCKFCFLRLDSLCTSWSQPLVNVVDHRQSGLWATRASLRSHIRLTASTKVVPGQQLAGLRQTLRPYSQVQHTMKQLYCSWFKQMEQFYLAQLLPIYLPTALKLMGSLRSRCQKPARTMSWALSAQTQVKTWFSSSGTPRVL